MAESRILELSRRIAADTEKLNAFLVANELPPPSFSVDAPLQSKIPQAETEVLNARQRVIEDTLELNRLVLGPREYLMWFSVSSWRDQHLKRSHRIAYHDLIQSSPKPQSWLPTPSRTSIAHLLGDL